MYIQIPKLEKTTATIVTSMNREKNYIHIRKHNNSEILRQKEEKN